MQLKKTHTPNLLDGPWKVYTANALLPAEVELHPGPSHSHIEEPRHSRAAFVVSVALKGSGSRQIREQDHPIAFSTFDTVDGPNRYYRLIKQRASSAGLHDIL